MASIEVSLKSMIARCQGLPPPVAVRYPLNDFHNNDFQPPPVAVRYPLNDFHNDTCAWTPNNIYNMWYLGAWDAVSRYFGGWRRRRAILEERVLGG